ncbi:Protein crumbs-like 1 [Hondaea fermentalgiana]|uniref:Protein crumbs-like 1 n=1 Tax=Hondaea fermentalgiana TaxID=2315210 RepID=A0A2R5GL63_9STRA|nr:Protein crumbs-like 1 [Hondaea fermentalgiana]|eukprot:GBG28614.1 Protein crumbs-like 1 [Hondaea fermentalgiana]
MRLATVCLLAVALARPAYAYMSLDAGTRLNYTWGENSLGGSLASTGEWLFSTGDAGAEGSVGVWRYESRDLQHHQSLGFSVTDVESMDADARGALAVIGSGGAGGPSGESAAGAVAVARYDAEADSWSVAQTLHASSPAAGAQFGHRVAIAEDGSIFVVAVSTSTSARATVYRFAANASGYFEEDFSEMVDCTAWYLKISLVARGNTVAMATFNGGSSSLATWRDDSGTWASVHSGSCQDLGTAPQNPHGTSFFAASAALIESNVLVVSDPVYEDADADVWQTGSLFVYIFNVGNSSWTLQTRLDNPYQVEGTLFGASLAAYDNYLAVMCGGGAGGPGVDSGALHLFEWDSQALVQTQVYRFPSDLGIPQTLSSKVSLSADAIFIGGSGWLDGAGAITYVPTGDSASRATDAYYYDLGEFAAPDAAKFVAGIPYSPMATQGNSIFVQNASTVSEWVADRATGELRFAQSMPFTIQDPSYVNVAVGPDLMVVGAYFDDALVEGTTDTWVARAGRLYVMRRNASTGLWDDLQYAQAPTLSSTNRLGAALAIMDDGTALAVDVAANTDRFELYHVRPGATGGYTLTRIVYPTGGVDWTKISVAGRGNQAAVASNLQGQRRIFLFERSADTGTWNTAGDAEHYAPSIPSYSPGNRFGRGLAFLARDTIAVSDPYDSPDTSQRGAVYIFEYDSDTDTLTQTQRLSDPSDAVGAYFGGSIISYGQNLAVTAPGIGPGDGTAGGVLFVYEYVDGSAQLRQSKTLPYLDHASTCELMAVGMSPLGLGVSCDLWWGTGGFGFLSSDELTTDAPTPEPTTGPTPAPTPLPTNEPTFAPTGYPTPAPTFAPTNFPTDAPTGAPTDAPTGAPTLRPTSFPTLSPTLAPTDKVPTCVEDGCENGEVCTPGPYPGDETVAATCQTISCDSHLDCAGQTFPGVLPHCREGACDDSLQGECSRDEVCETLVARSSNAERNAGAMLFEAPELLAGNVSDARAATLEVLGAVLADFATNEGSGATVAGFVTGVESAYFEGADLLEAIAADEAGAAAAIEDIVCGAQTRHCIATVTAGTGRRLAESIRVSVSYTVDEQTMLALAGDGTTFSQDAELAQTLAARLGISSTDISITGEDAAFEIEFIVTAAESEDPLGEEALASIEYLRSQVPAIAEAVYDALGVNPSALGVASVDPCAARNCNDRGTCDAETGVCACTISYWGINCETLIECASGTQSLYGPFCICEFPFYGPRCELVKECACAS